MQYIKKVDGKKVYLSLSIKEDLPLYTKWLNDPDINLTYGRSHIVFNESRQAKYIEDYDNSDDKFFFVIVSKELNKAVGIGLLYDIDYVHGKVTLGILLDKQYQSKGYGKEAINLLLDFSFNILNLNNAMLYAIDFNQKAIEIYKKIGFKIMGKRREAYYINNQTYDEVYMDILKNEFNKKLE